MLHENNVRTGFFERSEFEEVRANLPSHLQPLVTLAYVSGWRVISEILPLRVGQVDAQAKVVRLDPGTTKNNRGRQFNCGAIDEVCKVFAAQGGLGRDSQSRDVDRRESRLPRADGREHRRVSSAARMEGSDDGGGVPGQVAARLPPLGRSQSRSRRRLGDDGDENHRAQDAQRVRPLRHHQRR